MAIYLKHCSDNEDSDLGVDYQKCAKLHDLLRETETLSDDDYKVHIKWSEIEASGKRSYQRCNGARVERRVGHLMLENAAFGTALKDLNRLLQRKHVTAFFSSDLRIECVE